MATNRQSRLVIQTPEGISFSMQLAGPVSRCMAWLIDAAIVVFGGGLLVMVAGIAGFISADLAGALGILLYFVSQIGYGITMEWLWRGQTIGKRVIGIQVVDGRGLKLQFSQIAIRNLFRFFDHMPAFYLIGGTACLLSKHSQRLGDFAAGTVVIRKKKTFTPDLSHIATSKFNSLTQHPHLVARLRQSVTPQEATAAFNALVRREELDPQSRLELYSTIADAFRNRVPFPPEATETLSDEHYIRNVVELIFQAAK